jgi:hypothetical protein
MPLRVQTKTAATPYKTTFDTDTSCSMAVKYASQPSGVVLSLTCQGTCEYCQGSLLARIWQDMAGMMDAAGTDQC